ncbi:hypothetical protein M0805_002506 [Coniferiporia weirii]|nr:hypothetical protein M0805_002506 [Coniferiporia weirii]
MPKREPTPEPADESKYLIINYPYPLHANMSIESERYLFAHWIASCIGKDFLLAIYHKPSAPNMVIIEVAKSCPRTNDLLGAHKWREFLKNPEADEVNNESRVYYCHYKSGREVQKNGWKLIDVCEPWFKNYDPYTSPFVCNPYPESSFCEVPPETQTDYALCRHLPSDVFVRPKSNTKQSTAVPGSEVYYTDKKSSAAAFVQPKPSRSFAGAVSQTPSRANIERPKASSRSYSDASKSASLRSAIASDLVDPILSVPPGLGYPPGLIFPKANQPPSSDWGWEATSEAVVSDDTPDWPSSADIIATKLSTAVLNDGQEPGHEATEDDGQYWTEQPVRPVDWDKPICPVHKVFCRPGICQVMAKIERDKKRDAERQKNGDGRDAGWTQTKTSRGGGRGRGRGGQTRGNRSRGGGGRGRGGWC